ncbi:unnamed protein product, partial [Symbiodinium sp. CCMP2456]
MALVVWPWTCGKEAAVRFALAALKCCLAPLSASPTHSWIFVPLLHAAVGRLHPDALQAWESSPRYGALWSRVLANLRLAGSVPPASIVHALHVSSFPPMKVGHPARRTSAPPSLCHLLALSHIQSLAAAATSVESERAWKLWLFLPRMLLFRPPAAPRIPAAVLRARISAFQSGDWASLLPEASTASPPARGSASEPGAEQRVDKTVHLPHLGELSAARRALLSEPLAPGDHATLLQLRDPDRAAPGPSGLTADIARLLLDDADSSEAFCGVALLLARVRGLVVGDFLRHLVARTLAQRYSRQIDEATRHHQFALSTRAGAEALAHSPQLETDTDPSCTVLSVDGIGAFDFASRQGLLSDLQHTPEASAMVPFAPLFYGTPSAKIAAETVHFLLGALFDEKKLQLPVAPVILGVTFNLEQLVLEIKEQRKQELLDTIDAILESGSLDPGLAGKLKGKLMFGASQLWGKVGRAFFRPLSQRQYMKDLHGD